MVWGVATGGRRHDVDSHNRKGADDKKGTVVREQADSGKMILTYL